MKFIGQSPHSSHSPANIITDGEVFCTYQELPSIFERIQQYWAQQGGQATDCVALECENSVRAAVVLLFLLEHGYSVVLVGKDTRAQAEPIAKTLPAFCRWICTLTPIAGSADGALRQPEQWFKLAPHAAWNPNGRLAAVREKLYLKTSGSTGVPKSVVLPHTGLQGIAANCAARLDLTSADRIAIPVPIAHSYGLKGAFLASVAVQASIDLQKGANLLKFVQREREFQPNVTFVTPIFCETLVQGRRSPRPYRLTVAAGDCFRGDTFTKYEALFGCLVNLYGSTETCPITSGSPSDPFEVRKVTVGKPLTNIQFRVHTEDGQIATEPDVRGEVWCLTPYGFDEYVDAQGERVERNPDERDGWFRMKDLGKIRADGHIEVYGRCDHSVKRDGLLVTFGEIERALRSIAGVALAIVVAQGQSERGKRLVAWCVLQPGATLPAETIQTACREYLPRHAIPDKIALIDALPLLPNGKIDRLTLARMAAEL
jgi:acyl-coenzyme A synthetase/AMP-(fatty) acid ligase